MVDFLNKSFFKVHLFLLAKNCSNCKQRKLLGTGLCGFEEKIMVFYRICYSCNALYKVVGNQITFEGFFPTAEFKDE